MEHVESESHSWRIVYLLPPETLARLKRLRDRLADAELRRKLVRDFEEKQARRVA
jgi:hypothetical protein